MSRYCRKCGKKLTPAHNGDRLWNGITGERAKAQYVACPKLVRRGRLRRVWFNTAHDVWSV